MTATTHPTLQLVVAPTHHGHQPPMPAAGQQALDLEFTVGADVPATPPLPPRLVLVDAHTEFSRLPTARADLPPAGAWVARMAMAMVEVYLGQRPASQLIRWTTPDVLSHLQYSARVRAAHPSTAPRSRPGEVVRIGRYSIASMRVVEPADGIVEATVILIGPARPIPLAIRLEGLDGRWICTVVDSPDHSITGYFADDYSPGA